MSDVDPYYNKEVFDVVDPYYNKEIFNTEDDTVDPYYNKEVFDIKKEPKMEDTKIVEKTIEAEAAAKVKKGILIKVLSFFKGLVKKK